jgi:peptidyl-prolyl cis-trans isomerase A (cyclophilin A)
MTEATFVTSMGSFTVRLMPEHAPKTVANFLDLAKGSKAGTDPRRDPLGQPTTGRSSTGSSRTS